MHRSQVYIVPSILYPSHPPPLHVPPDSEYTILNVSIFILSNESEKGKLLSTLCLAWIQTFVGNHMV